VTYTAQRPVALATDPWTSHAAAESVAPQMRESQRQVLDTLKRFGPLSLHELVYMAQKNGVQQSDSGLRTRLHELVQQGLVEDSGEVTVTRSGRKAIVWRAVRQSPVQMGMPL
jgi:predicted ArsR family transcriptional regulator